MDLNRHRSNPNLTPQVALYDDGVGTETFVLLKLIGGAFGWGLKRNVLKLYTGVVRIYDPGDNIPKLPGTLVIGRIAYYLYAATCLAVALGAAVPGADGSRMLSIPALLLTLVCGFAIAALLAYYVDHRRSRLFSRFWHDARHDLRDSLKGARAHLLAQRVSAPPPPPPPNGGRGSSSVGVSA